MNNKKLLIKITIMVTFLLFFLNSFIIIDGEIIYKFSDEVCIFYCSNSDAEKLNKSYFPFLKRLIMYNCEADNLHFLGNMPSLNQFTLISTYEINDYSCITQCNELKSFMGAGLKFDNLNCFSNLKKLERLDISFHLSPMEIKSIAGLEKINSLKSLSLCNVESMYISEIESLTKLEHLSIKDSDITVININLNNLKSLYLCNNKKLKDCYISDKCSNLEYIDISGSDNISINLNELKCLPNLSYLVISNGQLKQNEIDLLESYGINIELS